MVYESDFYTTRRPYRPSYSTYSVSSAPSRQVRILPGLGKVHVVHTYDRIVPYVGHKRLTVVTLPPKIYSTRSSVLQREYDWIENKVRPWVAYSPTNRYLNSDSAVIFDDETRLIRAQTASLLKQVHQPVPRIRTWPITPLNRFGDFPSLPMKYSNDTYIHRLLTYSPNHKIQYATYYTEPVKKYIGDKGYSRRRPLTMFEDALRNDIQLLSYYITKFRDEKQQPKEIKAPLSPARPSRIFSVHKPMEDPVAQEIKDLREARAQRLAKIYASDDKTTDEVEKSLKEKKRKEEARLAEERAIAEEQAKKEAEAARKAEIARQEQLAAQLAAERAAELERQAEQARQEELAKQAEIERMKREEEERARLEEQRRLEEEAKAEEERQQLLRLEEIARQAEEEKERELARQAEELAELARQEAERAEQERLEREQKEKEQKEAELAELARQETELAELERQEKELAELAAKAQEELAANEEEEEKTEEQAEPVVDEPEAEAQEEEPAEVEPEDEPEAEAEADE
ncbi:uncharacterized protein CG45076 isoform X7 [Tribolium castaneum]|uniref:uncharacterized protein CG45076 isoform X7 n=1 Tax=Tribolium castaneum TaxID=7070 RepID=UPI00017584ED|nr:PREDICTED: protein anoxia up-regulated isoform X6 [Tribolium castaneum]|eukprot:XP_970759.2 PREDICTED: protein anoxia up-regulated isoform X6 [Tribolium castaneum]